MTLPLNIKGHISVMLDRYRKIDIYWDLVRTIKVISHECWIGLGNMKFIGIF